MEILIKYTDVYRCFKLAGWWLYSHINIIGNINGNICNVLSQIFTQNIFLDRYFNTSNQTDNKIPAFCISEFTNMD